MGKPSTSVHTHTESGNIGLFDGERRLKYDYMRLERLVGSTFKLNNWFVTLPVKSCFVWLAKLQKLQILSRMEILEKLCLHKIDAKFQNPGGT